MKVITSKWFAIGLTLVSCLITFFVMKHKIDAEIRCRKAWVVRTTEIKSYVDSCKIVDGKHIVYFRSIKMPWELPRMAGKIKSGDYVIKPAGGLKYYILLSGWKDSCMTVTYPDNIEENCKDCYNF
ncbi:MAG: hypothetical protein J6T70_08800 [Bacteroidales bacterium]|nr:hypothetical protein [Bacteroidales bacterium]